MDFQKPADSQPGNKSTGLRKDGTQYLKPKEFLQSFNVILQEFNNLDGFKKEETQSITSKEWIRTFEYFVLHSGKLDTLVRLLLGFIILLVGLGLMRLG